MSGNQLLGITNGFVGTLLVAHPIENFIRDNSTNTPISDSVGIISGILIMYTSYKLYKQGFSSFL